MPGLEVFAYIAGAGAALAVLWRFVIRPLARFAALLSRFFGDWFGEDARPGLPDGRKGVMERLDALEARTRRTEWHVGNGNPEPLRTVVRRIETKQKGIEARLSGKKAPDVDDQ